MKQSLGLNIKAMNMNDCSEVMHTSSKTNISGVWKMAALNIFVHNLKSY
jgi:hypothetical protein